MATTRAAHPSIAVVTASCLLTLVLVGTATAGEPAANDPFKPLEPLLGKTWRGEMLDAEQPTFDVSHWELALNGKAVRIMHSLNDGAYGGETIIMWDQEQESLVFFYFTTQGFYTTGTFTVEDGRFISHEKVTGNADGITEVRAVGEILDDGRLRSSSQYLKNGEWVDGHEFIYVEAPDAEVVLN